MWHPHGDDGPGAEAVAFAEVGKPLQIPAPLIRVPAGTDVIVSIRNGLADSTLAVHGLVSRPVPAGAPPEPVKIAPGATREVRFRLDAPGAYYYWATTTGRVFRWRTKEDAQLSGAIIVDEPRAPRPRDHIMVIGVWTDTTPMRMLRSAHGCCSPSTGARGRTRRGSRTAWVTVFVGA